MWVVAAIFVLSVVTGKWLRSVSARHELSLGED